MKGVNFGEANKYFLIFTKDFGLVRVAAQGVRHLKSKLRYGLSEYSLARISLVRGREVWRLTSAESEQTIKDQNLIQLWSRIFSLLLRLLHGEERNDFLFASLEDGLAFSTQNILPEEVLNSLECILALRILSSLGYIGKLGQFDKFIESPYFTLELLVSMSALKTQAILEINKSLKETHL